MLFCTFQSLDFMKKPLLSEDEKIPDNLFKGDTSKGVSWCMPMTKSFQDSIVNAWMACPNFAQVFIIFESDDYHKIDKIKWYQDLAKKCQTDFWDYIDDNIDDNYAEYVVPYSETTNLKIMAFPLSIGSMEENTLKCVPSLGYFLEKESKFIFDVAVKNFNLYFPYDLTTEGMNEDEILYYQRLSQTVLFRVFSFSYFPLLFIPSINSYLIKDKKDFIKFIGGWDLYVDKFFGKFMDLQNKYANWTLKVDLDKRGFDEYRNKFMELLHCDLEIIKARINGLGRNELCPCGSGKKFKKCCGKGFC